MRYLWHLCLSACILLSIFIILTYSFILQPETDVYASLILQLFIAGPSYMITILHIYLTEAQAPMFYMGLLCSTINPIIQMESNPQFKSLNKRLITTWTGIRFPSTINMSTSHGDTTRRSQPPTPAQQQSIPAKANIVPHLVNKDFDRIRANAFKYFSHRSIQPHGISSNDTTYSGKKRKAPFTEPTVRLTTSERANALPKHDLLNYIDDMLADLKY